LYNKAKKQIEKKNKTKEDYEFERNSKECSFTQYMLAKQPKYHKKYIFF
jgi:hypothetical protein